MATANCYAEIFAQKGETVIAPEGAEITVFGDEVTLVTGGDHSVATLVGRGTIIADNDSVVMATEPGTVIRCHGTEVVTGESGYDPCTWYKYQDGRIVRC